MDTRPSEEELYRQFQAEKRAAQAAKQDAQYAEFKQWEEGQKAAWEGATPPREPTMRDYVRDARATVLKSTMDATEGMADLLLSPLNLLERTAQGLTGLTDDNPETGFWNQFGQRGEVGGWTADFFDPARKILTEESQIPEGVANPYYEKGRTFAEHALPIIESGGVGKIAPTSSKALQMTQQALRTGAPASGVASGTGAVAGQEMAGDEGEAVGSIAGAIVGNPIEAGKWAINKVGNAYRLARPGTTKAATASKADMRDALTKYFEQAFPREGGEADPDYIEFLVDKAIKRIDQGESGTFAQLADDLGLSAFEQKLAAESPERARQLESIDRGIEGEARARVDSTVSGEPTLAREPVLAETQRATEELAASKIAEKESQLQQARAAEQEAQDIRTGFYDEVDTKVFNEANPSGMAPVDKLGSEGYTQLKNNIGQAYDEAWDAAGVLKKQTFNKMVKYGNSLKEADPATYNKIDKLLDAVETFEMASPTSQSVKAVDKMIRDEINRLPYDAHDAREYLKGLRNILMDDMPKAGRERLNELNSNYDKFLTIRGAGDRTPAGERVRAETYEAQSRSVAPSGATQEGKAPMQQTLEDARLNEQQVEQYVSEAESNLSKAERQAQTMRERATSQAEKEIAKTPAGKFAANEAEQYLSAASDTFKAKTKGGKTPAANMKAIIETAKTPAERDNIRRAFLEEMEQNVFALNSEGRVGQKAIEKFNARRDAYEQSGMFTKEELDTMAASVEQMQKIYLADEAKAIAALPLETSQLVRKMAGIAGTLAGGAATGGSHALMVAGRARNIAEKLAESATSGRVKELIYQLSSNPQRYADVFKQYADDLSTPELQASFINALLAKAGIATAQEQIED